MIAEKCAAGIDTSAPPLITASLGSVVIANRRALDKTVRLYLSLTNIEAASQQRLDRTLLPAEYMRWCARRRGRWSTLDARRAPATGCWPTLGCLP